MGARVAVVMATAVVPGMGVQPMVVQPQLNKWTRESVRKTGTTTSCWSPKRTRGSRRRKTH